MIDIFVPAEQEGTKAIVRAWLKKIGDPVAENDPLVELETDKVTQEVPSPAAGILVEILLDTDAEAVPGTLLGRMRRIEDVEPKAVTTKSEAQSHSEAEAHPGLANRSMITVLSPAVRRAIIHHQVNPADVKGSGRNGRITRADVDAFVALRGPNSEPVASPPQPAPSVAPVTSLKEPGAQVVRHDRMRLAIAANMLNSVTTAPHVTAVFEADFSAIIAHRRRHKAEFEKSGASLTITAYLIAAAARAMAAAPSINSRWFDDRLEIFDAVNVGVGTALGDKGLVVPVVRDVQSLSLFGIASRLTDLTNRARMGKLTGIDMQGGTFTVSNHGVSGSLLATPIIIVQPQSAILGIGKVEKRVVVREIDGVDTIQIRPMCYISLTIDHRVVDGHQTNAWLAEFVKAIEAWN